MWWSTVSGKLEQATSLDGPAKALESAVRAVLPQSAAKDVLHGRWLGHPVHPLLVAVPIGLWSGATLLDLTTGPSGRAAAQRLIGAGVLAVVPTAASGLADWSEVGAFDRPKRVGLVHAAANTVTAILYGASWLARRRGQQARGRNLALLGAAGLTAGGYLGGHLAYSEGVGVNRNADAPLAPSDWTDALPVGDLGIEPVRVDVDGQPLVMVRTPQGVSALGATCSHYGAPLEEGELEDGCLVCPWHGSRFRLSDGSVARGPATFPQRSFEVRTQGDRLQVRVRT